MDVPGVQHCVRGGVLRGVGPAVHNCPGATVSGENKYKIQIQKTKTNTNTKDKYVQNTNTNTKDQQCTNVQEQQCEVRTLPG